MTWLLISCLLALVIYAVFLLANIVSASRKIQVHPAAGSTARVTVIVPCRNEAHTIEKCLLSISQQDFSPAQLEVIVADDHSEDSTAGLASAYLQKSGLPHQVIQLGPEEHGKKQAIQKAVAASTGDFIVTRDADTVSSGKQWLSELVYELEAGSCEVVIGPVLLSGDGSFAAAFQRYENLALLMLGRGMARSHLPIVCSGANLAYKKELFVALDPYRDNLRIASGDDMFLLKKAFAAGRRIGAAAAASAVHTPAEVSLKAAFLQRLRWASKTPRVLTLPVFFSGLILLMGNIAALVGLICIFIDGAYLPFGLFTLIIKLLIDFLLLFLSARMFNAKLKPAWYLPAFLLNLFYTPVISLAAVFARPSWKGRRI